MAICDYLRSLFGFRVLLPPHEWLEARVFYLSSTDVDQLILHPITRPDISITSQTTLEVGMTHWTMIIFTQLLNQLQMRAQFLQRGPPI